MPAPKPPREAAIQAAIREALGREPDLVLWRNNVGLAQHGEHAVRYGLIEGSADLVGILGPQGRFMALEVKRPRGKPTEAQELFLALVRRRGGFAAVVRSVEEAVAALARARAGACE